MINIRNAEITDAERLVEIYGYSLKKTTHFARHYI